MHCRIYSENRPVRDPKRPDWAQKLMRKFSTLVKYTYNDGLINLIYIFNVPFEANFVPDLKTGKKGGERRFALKGHHWYHSLLYSENSRNF
jgi:hypothetical protein